MEQASKKGTIKAVIFLLFIVFAVILFRYTSAGEYIRPRFLQEWVNGFGSLAPVVFILIYGIGISLFLPATLFTGIGALLFGAFWGFLYNIAGALLGASVGFFIGRHLGRDFAASLIGDRLKKYDEKIAVHGFAATLYLRLVFFPYTPLNFGMGLTRVRFSAFFFGTLFGILAGGFAMTFFFATLAEVWASGEWGTIMNWKSALAIGLFVASFFIPKIAKKMKLIAGAS